MTSYNKMAATKCRFRLDFVRLSIKICRFSSTLTGTASKYICCIVPLYKITNKRGIAIETGVACVRFGLRSFRYKVVSLQVDSLQI